MLRTQDGIRRAEVRRIVLYSVSWIGIEENSVQRWFAVSLFLTTLRPQRVHCCIPSPWKWMVKGPLCTCKIQGRDVPWAISTVKLISFMKGSVFHIWKMFILMFLSLNHHKVLSCLFKGNNFLYANKEIHKCIFKFSFAVYYCEKWSKLYEISVFFVLG